MQDEPSSTDVSAEDPIAETPTPRESRAPFIAFVAVMALVAVVNFWPRKHTDGVQPGTLATAVGMPWTYWEKGIFPISENRGTGTISTRFYPLWFVADIAIAVVVAGLAATGAWYLARSSEESGIREAETVDA